MEEEARNVAELAALGRAEVRKYLPDADDLGPVYAVLRGRDVVPIEMEEWAKWFATIDNRQIGLTERAGVTVSTVFLGINHSIFSRRPLWFESLVFGGPHDEEMRRYTTYDEAEAGHAEMCRLVFGPEQP